MTQIITRTPLEMHKGTVRVERILINDAISLDIRAQKFRLIFPYKRSFIQHPSILHCKL